MASLRIGTWNVLGDAYIEPSKYPRSPPALLVAGARAEHVCHIVFQLIDRHRLDVVCLQEVEPTLLDALHATLGARGWQTRWTPKGAGARDGCAALISRAWEVTASDSRFYARAPDHSATRLVLFDGATSVTLHHTHLQWQPDDGDTLRLQSAQLASWTREDRGITVVAGDLNSPPGSPALAELTRAGFRDAHPDPGLRTAFIEGAGPLRLDYILARSADIAALASPLVAVDSIEPLPGPRMPSDHVPLTACVSIR